MGQYTLTSEGKEYLENGLPEKQLVDFLNEQSSKSAPVDDVKKINNMYIAIQWALKNKWIQSTGKELILIDYPKSFPEQDALEKIDMGEDIDENLLNILLQRKLIKKVIIGEADKMIGKEITNLTPELLKTGLWKQVKFQKYDVNVPVNKTYPGKMHPYRQVMEEIREKLIGMGFVEAKGPLVELNFWNSDTLFMPSDHPARGVHDIYMIKDQKT